jgi:hypothetical protein
MQWKFELLMKPSAVPDLTTLFVTTTQDHFFKAETNRVGWAMYP